MYLRSAVTVDCRYKLSDNEEEPHSSFLNQEVQLAARLYTETMTTGTFGMLGLLAILAAATLHHTSACSCIPFKSPRHQFCQAGFAMKAKVVKLVSEDPPYGVRVYEVKVKQMFRNTQESTGDEENSKRTMNVVSRIGSATCGVTLSEKKTYLLTGHIYDKEFQISSCDLILNWKEMTKKENKFYRRRNDQKRCKNYQNYVTVIPFYQ